MTTLISPVMGKVAGFVIIRNEVMRIEFVDVASMKAEVERVRELDRDFWKKHPEGVTGEAINELISLVPSDQYFTMFRRDDNDVIEEQEAMDTSGETTIGQPFVKLTCVKCQKNSAWFPIRPTGNGQYECEDCGDL